MWYDLLQHEMQKLEDKFDDEEKVSKVNDLMLKATEDHCACKKDLS